MLETPLLLWLLPWFIACFVVVGVVGNGFIVDVVVSDVGGGRGVLCCCCCCGSSSSFCFFLWFCFKPYC